MQDNKHNPSHYNSKETILSQKEELSTFRAKINKH